MNILYSSSSSRLSRRSFSLFSLTWKAGEYWIGQVERKSKSTKEGNPRRTSKPSLVWKRGKVGDQFKDDNPCLCVKQNNTFFLMGTATLDLIWLKVFISLDSSGDWASFSGLSMPKWCFLQSWKKKKRGWSIKFLQLYKSKHDSDI